MGQFLIVHGNLKDGFDFIGPFDGHEAAVEYATRLIRQDFWQVVELTAPDEE